MPFLELFPESTAVVGAGWNNPTNAYTYNNSYATSTTNNAEQSYNYGGALSGGEVLDKVFVRIKYIYLLTGVAVGDDATCTFSVKVYDGSSWTTYQVTKAVYSCTTASDESLTDTIGDNSNSVVAIDVTAKLGTLTKLNSAQTSLLTAITADAGLTPQVQVDCVSILVCYHTVGDVYVSGGAATTKRDVDRKEYRAIRKVAESLQTS